MAVSTQNELKINSNFPSVIDTFETKQGFNVDNLDLYRDKVQRLNTLRAKSELTTLEKEEFIQKTNELSKYMISSNDINKIFGALIKIEESLSNYYSKNVVTKTITSNVSSITFGNNSLYVDTNCDLDVYANGGVLLILGDDYTLSSDGTSIIRANGGVFKATVDYPLTLHFVITKHKA